MVTEGRKQFQGMNKKRLPRGWGKLRAKRLFGKLTGSGMLAKASVCIARSRPHTFLPVGGGRWGGGREPNENSKKNQERPATIRSRRPRNVKKKKKKSRGGRSIQTSGKRNETRGHVGRSEPGGPLNGEGQKITAQGGKSPRKGSGRGKRGKRRGVIALVAREKSDRHTKPKGSPTKRGGNLGKKAGGECEKPAPVGGKGVEDSAPIARESSGRL